MRSIVFALAALLSGPSIATDYRSPDYAHFLRNPAWYAKDPETLAYVRGAIEVLKYSRLCSDEAFRTPKTAMRELVTFAKTADGYITAVSEFDGIRNNVGAALVSLADHKGCKERGAR